MTVAKPQGGRPPCRSLSEPSAPSLSFQPLSPHRLGGEPQIKSGGRWIGQHSSTGAISPRFPGKCLTINNFQAKEVQRFPRKSKLLSKKFQGIPSRSKDFRENPIREDGVGETSMGLPRPAHDESRRGEAGFLRGGLAVAVGCSAGI